MPVRAPEAAADQSAKKWPRSPSFLFALKATKGSKKGDEDQRPKVGDHAGPSTVLSAHLGPRFRERDWRLRASRRVAESALSVRHPGKPRQRGQKEREARPRAAKRSPGPGPTRSRTRRVGSQPAPKQPGSLVPVQPRRVTASLSGNERDVAAGRRRRGTGGPGKQDKNKAPRARSGSARLRRHVAHEGDKRTGCDRPCPIPGPNNGATAPLGDRGKEGERADRSCGRRGQGSE